MHDLKCYQENIYANGVMASAYICYLYTTMAIGDKYRQNIIDFFCFYLFWGTVKCEMHCKNSKTRVGGIRVGIALLVNIHEHILLKRE